MFNKKISKLDSKVDKLLWDLTYNREFIYSDLDFEGERIPSILVSEIGVIFALTNNEAKNVVAVNEENWTVSNKKFEETEIISPIKLKEKIHNKLLELTKEEVPVYGFIVFKSFNNKIHNIEEILNIKEFKKKLKNLKKSRNLIDVPKIIEVNGIIKDYFKS